jgi:demethylmenaquinone methyltransferase/2-methoxy-6-polyprenyl-1,4-benzoquinol methylase
MARDWRQPGQPPKLSPMARNTTGQQAEVHDRQIRDMFAGIAGVYDRMNGLLSLGLDDRWRRQVARAIDPGAIDILDACTGTGELLLAARRMGRGTHHVGSDFCEPMLRAGIRDNGLAREARGVIAADTQRLPFATGSFDAVLVGFGLRNLGELDRGLEEIHRVLRPGGQLLTLEFFRVSRQWLETPVSFYLSRMVPVLGRIVGGDGPAYSYLPESMGRFVTVREFCERLQNAGFEPDIRVDAQTLGIAHLVCARSATTR